MAFINIEIKARTKNAKYIRQYLLDNKADFIGMDEQTDTYFNVPNGRLKLREGIIENNLIFYSRNNQKGPKQSDFNLLPVSQPLLLKEILASALGKKIIVQKNREIYFIGNVKFHIDCIEGLGEFVEIEANNKIKNLSVEDLTAQCDYYMIAFGILTEDLIDISYSDMLLEIFLDKELQAGTR